MKISLQWLKSYFTAPTQNIWDNTIIADSLTMAGLEVENLQVEDVKVEDLQVENLPVENLNNDVIELGITPNRGDCLSLRGVIREITAINQELQLNQRGHDLLSCQLPQNAHTQSSGLTISIERDAEQACSYYSALTIHNINNQAQLPPDILNAIGLAGLKSVSPVVDITNYVMLELGTPLHAFDMEKISPAIHIRMAQSNETITLLDNTKATLTNNTLLITNHATNTPIAIAGVMGSLESKVTASTQHIVLESAYFNREIIAGKAKLYNVSSDAAYRFERGVDVALQEYALQYTANLIKHYCGGEISNVSKQQTSAHQQLLTRQPIKLKLQELDALLGISSQANSSMSKDILERLGCTVNITSTDELHVVPPSWRFDINSTEDLIEEIARIYGYANIPATMPSAAYMQNIIDAGLSTQKQLKQHLVTLGFNEIISYAFLERKYEESLGNRQVKCIELHNSIANLDVMRTSLVADLIKSLAANLNRGHSAVRLFELARVFHGTESSAQPLKLGILMHGNLYQSSWNNNTTASGFFDLKSVVEQLLSGLDSTLDKISFKPNTTQAIFHPGQCADIYLGEHILGIIGSLNTNLTREFGLNTSPYIAELDVHMIIDAFSKHSIRTHNVSKFQKVARDLAFVVAKSTQVGAIIDAVEMAKIEHLININVFDIYPIAESNNKSIALRFTFQALDKTLSDADINTSINTIIEIVTSKFAAQLR